MKKRVGVFTGLFCSVIFWSAMSSAQSCRELFVLQHEQLLPAIFQSVAEVATGDLHVSLHHAPFNSSEVMQVKLTNSDNRSVGESVLQLRETPVQTVVYPGSGLDSAAGFLMFPDATTLIGVDIHPFVNSLSDVVHPELPKSLWREYNSHDEVDVYFAKGVVAPLIGRLQTGISGFRLRRVSYFVEGASPGDVTEMNQRYAITELLPRDTSVHGWIEFDTGEGTPVRRYVHVHQVLQSSSTISAQTSAILKQGFQAVIAKGAMLLFSPFEKIGGGYTFTDYLRFHGGVLVNADQAATLKKFETPSFVSIKRFEVPVDTLLGYGLNSQRGVELTQFIEDPPVGPATPGFLDYIK